MLKELLPVISSFGDLMFWFLFLIAVCKYDVLRKLPGWLSVPMVLAICMGSVAGLLLHYL